MKERILIPVEIALSTGGQVGAHFRGAGRASGGTLPWRRPWERISTHFAVI